MNWSEFAQATPELAELAKLRLEPLSLIGTLRRDGYPRISPIEAIIMGERLMLGMMWRSRKALDLLRDPRCVLHNAVSNADGSQGEAKLWGRAVDVTDAGLRARYGDACQERFDWRPTEPYHLFELDIERAAYVVSNDQRQLSLVWRAGRALERRERAWTGSGYAE